MTKTQAPPLSELESRVAEITSKKAEIPRELIQPSSRLIEDLNMDSLTFIEVVMAVEEEFGVAIPYNVEKQASANGPLTIGGLAKAVQDHWGTETRKTTD